MVLNVTCTSHSAERVDTPVAMDASLHGKINLSSQHDVKETQMDTKSSTMKRQRYTVLVAAILIR